MKVPMVVVVCRFVISICSYEGSAADPSHPRHPSRGQWVAHTFQAIRGQTMVRVRNVSEAGEGGGKEERGPHYG